MAAFIHFEAVTSLNFQVLNQKSYRFLVAAIFSTFINYGFLEVYDDCNFFKIFDYFLQKWSNAAILKMIEISKIATKDLQQISQSYFQVIQFIEKCDAILHPPFSRLERFEPCLILCYIGSVLVSQ